jgi:hypothetical protein
MIKLTGLWSNIDKNGNLCLSGYLGDSKLLIFANTYKKEDKQPDFIVYIDEKKKITEEKQESLINIQDDGELPF